MPFDFQFEDAAAVANVERAVGIVAVPGGTFLKGKPYDGLKPFRGKADVRLAASRILDGGRTESIPQMARAYEALEVDGPVRIETGRASLAPGNYRLEITVGGRTEYRFFRAAERPRAPAAAPSDDTWKLGGELWRHVFAKPGDAEFSEGTTRAGRLGDMAYLEAGGNGSLGGDRYGVEMTFAPESLGKPCCIEILWPDDKPRAMAFAMHPATSPRSPTYHRDRLQCGVFAGEAYPNSGEMRQVRYLFYPFVTNYLFEARTLLDSRPAAVALVSVREIVGEWPVLKVEEPQGYPARRFGYQDEDQTFFHNLNADFHGFRQVKITEETLRYLAYTGQNAFHYPLARYAATLGAMENSLGGAGNGLWPGYAGEMGAVIGDFTAAGVDWIGEVYMGRIGEARFARLIDSRHAQDGWFSLDRYGNGVGRTFGGLVGNIACEPYVEAFLDNFMPFAGQMAKRGMKGVRHWFGGNIGSMESGTWNGLGWGYDDWTVGRFAADAGVSLPANCLAGHDRFANRYRFLVEGDAAVRAKWLEWRAGRVTAFVRRYREKLDAAAPGMPLTLVFGQAGATVRSLYETNGMDFAALGAIRGVTFGLDRNPTLRLFRLYRRWDAPKEEDNYRLSDPLAARVRSLDGGAVTMVCEHNTYFETFRNSLCPKRFNTYFQSFDVKPNGRNYLKTFAYDVGVMDALSVTIGDQPIGTLGAEAEAREFAKAFRALPAVPFEDVPGFAAKDGVVARRFAAKDGSEYWYFVNMTGKDMSVDAPFRGSVRDLSSGRDAMFARIDLKPYQLRSFRARTP